MPGPWTCGPLPIEGELELRPDFQVWPVGGGSCIALVYQDDELDAGNAHLISAAPELLYYLKFCLRYLPQEIRLSVEKTIAKAEGP